MKKKIIVKMQGGLGNQMYEYAVGRALSIKYNKKLYLDTAFYECDRKRKYELSNYNIIVSKDMNLLSARIYRILWYFSENKKWRNFLSEKLGVGFEDEEYIYQDNKDKVYLDGYWQNERYFEEIKKELTDELTYKGELNQHQKSIIENMDKEASVAVHIRRGDYLELQELYSILKKDYYKHAIEYLEKVIEEPLKFYFFSDDIEWCKKEFSTMENCIFIDAEVSDSHYVDFELMRNCHHFIIANSTFSWWASWLSKYKNKVIIAPNEWFTDSRWNQKLKKGILKNTKVI